MTVSQLRDTKRLKWQLRAGKPIELYDRNKLIAHVIPEKRGWPDFEAQALEILGDGVLPGSDLLIQEGGRY